MSECVISGCTEPRAESRRSQWCERHWVRVHPTPRVTALEASERELQQRCVDLEATVIAILDATDKLRHVDTGSMGPFKRVRADLPAAAREHLARDAEREQALRWIGSHTPEGTRYPSGGTSFCSTCIVMIDRAGRALEPPDA